LAAPAVTRDGRWVLFAEQTGITTLAANGRNLPRMLFPLTNTTWEADSGPDGALYVDQMDRPVSDRRARRYAEYGVGGRWAGDGVGGAAAGGALEVPGGGEIGHHSPRCAADEPAGTARRPGGLPH